MINKILLTQPNNNYTHSIVKKKQDNNVSFQGINPRTVGHIGSKMDGFIGTVNLSSANDSIKSLAHVIKRTSGTIERYEFRDEFQQILGEMTLKIDKYSPSAKLEAPLHASHVYISDLIDYTNPEYPKHNKKCAYSKDVMVRLLQIAQRRSDETKCFGNIDMFAYPEDMNRLKDLGFKVKYDGDSHYNQCIMSLKDNMKEALSKLSGGL